MAGGSNRAHGAGNRSPGLEAGPSAGGGALLDQASHHFDLAPVPVRGRDRRVSAELHSHRSEDDTAVVNLRLTRGPRSIVLSIHSVNEDRIEVYAERQDFGGSLQTSWTQSPVPDRAAPCSGARSFVRGSARDSWRQSASGLQSRPASTTATAASPRCSPPMPRPGRDARSYLSSAPLIVLGFDVGDPDSLRQWIQEGGCRRSPRS